jgi:hypothetical protein
MTVLYSPIFGILIAYTFGVVLKESPMSARTLTGIAVGALAVVSMPVADPATWTAPWSFEMPLKRSAEAAPFEYACHEGNLGLANILSAARAAERDAK